MFSGRDIFNDDRELLIVGRKLERILRGLCIETSIDDKDAIFSKTVYRAKEEITASN